MNATDTGVVAEFGVGNADLSEQALERVGVAGRQRDAWQVTLGLPRGQP